MGGFSYEAYLALRIENRRPGSGLAGLICLLAGYWDKLLAGGCACREALSKKCRGGCAEFDDYDDDLLYE